ncbi:protein kinase [Acanthopleuribacter pedis]|uniref:Protein kinase n=2 Tax=Acanthopleuribacter pedis TaxID=442870 RepID=A0A8J7QHY1_9BACT|nr:protein kinase [Acanthopleuribacter pedis]
MNEMLIGWAEAGSWMANSVAYIGASVGLVLNILVLSAFIILLDRTIGIGRGFLWGLRMCWQHVPRGLQFGVAVVGAVAVCIDVNQLILYLLSDGDAVTAGEGYLAIASAISRYTFQTDATTANVFFLVVLSIAIMLGYYRAPVWQRIRCAPSAAEKTISGTMAAQGDARARKKIARAEQLVEEGRLGKAAKILESLGEEYCYRAGKLYVQRGHHGRAAAAFLRGGDYYARIGNYLRAGNAYYFGNHWEKAVEAFSRMKPSSGFLEDRERVSQWGQRWGESLFHLGRFEESAEIYLRFEMFQKAGESFEKAGMVKEAAAAFDRAGSFTGTTKVSEEHGETQKVWIEKAKAAGQQGEWAQAGAYYEKLGDFEAAALAFLKGNLKRKAAHCFFTNRRFDKALELFLEVGEEEKALQCYQELGQYQRAAMLAAELGLQDRQAELFRKGGDYVRAARAYLMIGELSQAIDCLRLVNRQRVDEIRECVQIISILTEQKRLEDALECGMAMIRGHETEKNLLPMVHRVIDVLLRLDDVKRAAELAFRLADQNPNDDSAVQLAKNIGQRVGITYRVKNASIASSLSHLVETPMLPDPRMKAVPQNRRNPAAQTPLPAVDPFPVPTPVAPPVVPVPQAVAPPGRAKRVANPFLPESEQGEVTLTLDDESIYDLTRDGPLRRYRIIKELGKGGMGRVYKALDTRLDRKVALKMLHPELNHEPKVLLFFKREVRSIASLNHPNIVQLYDAGMEKGCFYMVMEYVKGATLDKLALRQPDNLLKSMVAIWHQACTGLKYAHEAGIIHRDIKPTNIMVNKSRTVKILDFGLAKQVSDTNQTQQLWGTPTFMAPELFLGDRATFQTDIYSMGATFYVLATGREPFGQDNASAKFAGNGLPEPPHKLEPKIPVALSNTILRCFYLNPRDRFESVDALIAQLRQIGGKGR